MGKVFVLANQKGGSGKTTTAINLGSCLAEEGKKVLLIDMDPQGNVSKIFGVGDDFTDNTIYECLKEESSLEDCTYETDYKNLFIVPSTIKLCNGEAEFMGGMEREFLLSSVIENYKKSYDYIIIDNPPSLGLLSVNGMVAADELIICAVPGVFSLMGMEQLRQTYNKVRKRLNTKLNLYGVLICKAENTTTTKKLRDILKLHFDGKALSIEIPKCADIDKAHESFKPINFFKKYSSAGIKYTELAKEIIDNG